MQIAKMAGLINLTLFLVAKIIDKKSPLVGKIIIHKTFSSVYNKAELISGKCIKKLVKLVTLSTSTHWFTPNYDDFTKWHIVQKATAYLQVLTCPRSSDYKVEVGSLQAKIKYQINGHVTT